MNSLSNPGRLDRLFSSLEGHDRIGLAVSGGVDSLALMILAHGWAAGHPRKPTLFVYSVDHGLRPEAATEVGYILDQAGRLGLAGRALKWQHDDLESGVQERARLARYHLIGAAMAGDGVSVLATGHHRSDQAETVLMRLAHGSGIEGLRGMDPLSMVEGVAIARPLLSLDRADLVRIVHGAGLTPVEDPSNEDRAYERVRWRKAMPALAELGLDARTIARFAQRMGDADRALAEIAHAAFDTLVGLDGFGSARIERRAFDALAPAIAQRVLTRVLKVAGGRQKPRALGSVEKLHEAMMVPGKLKTVTVMGCVVRADEATIMVAREPGRQLPEDLALAPGGELIWDSRFRICNGSDSAGFMAGVSDYLPRHRLQDFLGFKVTAPAEAIRTAPIVRDADGGVLSLGGWSFDSRISVELLID